ncbi:YybH family protein [Granulicella cerasi]|uniref:YybH family protein n=1 Tax=Granulicella cerasi TaxID=741063 RepID=UPI0021E03C73|nr:nuclear transport factor 2 family protein [Granulicella cerasi]
MRLLCVTLAAAITPGIAPAQQSKDSIEVPSSLRQHFVAGTNARSTEALLPLFTQDASWTDAKGQTVSGKSSLQALFTSTFDHLRPQLSLTVISNYSEGTPKQATSIREDGSYDETIFDLKTSVSHHECGHYRFVYTPNPEGGWLIGSATWTTGTCPAPKP